MIQVGNGGNITCCSMREELLVYILIINWKKHVVAMEIGIVVVESLNRLLLVQFVMAGRLFPWISSFFCMDSLICLERIFCVNQTIFLADIFHV